MTHVGARIERGEKGKGGWGWVGVLACMYACDLCEGDVAECCMAQVMQVVAQVWIQHSRLQLLSIGHISTAAPEPS